MVFDRKAYQREYMRKYREVAWREVAWHLRKVLIAFAHPEPLPEHYESVSEASLFLQSIDEDWKRVCNTAPQEIEKEFMAAVEEAGLMTGAWTGVPWDDLPKNVQHTITTVVMQLHSDWQDW